MIKQVTGTTVGRIKKLKSIIGQLPLSEKQARILKLKSHQRISPYLEECCLRVSANVSYKNAAQDVECYTGMRVSEKTQQRLVHRYQFTEFNCSQSVEEVSVDGGKVRLRTEERGTPCIWRDYKAVCLHPQARMAWFQENETLIEWVNHQPLEHLLHCVGDGHSGVGNLMKRFNRLGNTQEILDWFHLVENLYKVGGSNKRIEQGKSLLWQGKVDETRSLFSPLKKKQAQNFCTYLDNHRHRIINYSYYQAENICAIASGAVESTVKQIDRRLKIEASPMESRKCATSLETSMCLSE